MREHVGDDAFHTAFVVFVGAVDIEKAKARELGRRHPLLLALIGDEAVKQ